MGCGKYSLNVTICNNFSKNPKVFQKKCRYTKYKEKKKGVEK